MDSTRILDAFYPGASVATAQAARARRLWLRMRGSKKSPRRKKKMSIPILVVGSLVAAVWGVFHLYFYNLLVNLECNVQAAWAQVDVQLERRYHIEQNLTQIVLDYSKYEKDTLSELIAMRTEAAGGEKTAEELSLLDQFKQLTKSQLDSVFPDVLLVAEQYPELKLSANFQQFIVAIIDNETKIADRVTEYNAAVNTYTTVSTQFPGNLFAATFRFPTHEFYLPDEETLKFERVKY